MNMPVSVYVYVSYYGVCGRSEVVCRPANRYSFTMLFYADNLRVSKNYYGENIF